MEVPILAMQTGHLPPLPKSALSAARRCWLISSLCALCLAGFSTRSALAAAYLYNAWWSNPIDLDGDLCVSSARLNWDADVVGGVGSSTIYERIYYRLTGNSSWILYRTTAPHTIYGASALDSLYITIPGSGLCAFYDYRIEVYQFGSTLFYDDAVHLYAHAEEGAAFDVPIFASIYDAWWTAPQDADGDGCVSSARLNWDVDLIGTTGTLNVYEKIYYKPTGTATWMLYTTTTTHPITGSLATDTVYLTIPGGGSCTLYDYRIQVYLAGFALYDDFADPSNDSSLAAHREEEFDGPPPDVTDPRITISAPTASPSYFTTADPLDLGGTASDNVGVILVTWKNNRGGEGEANGRGSWSVEDIPLALGINVITITAFDLAGNTSTDTLTVTYNPFSPVFGSYNGLIHEPDCVRHQSSGAFKLNLSAKGSYSAAVQIGGKRLSGTGKFDGTGLATNYVRLQSNFAVITWAVDLHGSQQVTGQVTATDWKASLLGDRAQIYSTTNPAPHQGSFTWRIPGVTADANLPGGDGGGNGTVGRTHALSLSGALADGTTLAQKIQISKEGKGPLYASLLSGKGSIIGWLNFDTNAPSDDFAGTVCWVRPALPTKKLYTQGFTFPTEILGSLYRKPIIPVTRALDLTNALVELHGGGLPRGITNDVVLRFDSVFINQGTNALMISVNISKGTYKGTATEGGSTQRVTFKGALFQKDSSGSGFFLGTNESGRVRILRSDP